MAYAKSVHMQMQLACVKKDAAQTFTHIRQTEHVLENCMQSIMMLLFKFSMYDISLLALKKEITDIYTNGVETHLHFSQAQWQKLQEKIDALHQDVLTCIQSCVKNNLEKEYLLLQCRKVYVS